MPYLCVRHRVRDYGFWRSLFDRAAGKQNAAGARPPFEALWLQD